MVSDPITSRQIDREEVEAVTDFIFLGSKVIADGDCSHEIKRSLLLGRKVMTNLDSIVKIRVINKGLYIQSCGFFPSSYIFKWETIKKAELWRTDVFKLWCWRRLLRFPWTARRSNKFILKEIKPDYSLVRPMFKLKLQYFGHLIRRTDSLEKTLMLGKIEGRKRRGTEDEMVGWHHWLNGHEFEQTLGDSEG